MIFPASSVIDLSGLRTRIDQKNSTLLFEVAWEVCNQVGGIYTVLKTKAPETLEKWGEHYYLVGPYHQQAAAVEFEETSLEGDPINQAIQRLNKQGLVAHVGRWLVPGKPRAILLDYKYRYGALDKERYHFWHDHGIAYDDGDWELNDYISFGVLVTELFTALHETVPNLPMVAHFHEWLASAAIPRLRHLQIPIATVFTTHATLLGRYMAANNPNFYRDLPHINPEAEAKNYNIVPRFGLEKAAVHAAHVFTTISDITAREAEKLLGRKADLILPNGLNAERFTALHEFQNLHLKFKERIHEFVMGHFFPSYTFDLDRTLYIFTSGRYEYKNKGMDLFIESLYQLNKKLKRLPNPPTVVAFIITKAQTRSLNVQALQHHLMLEDLKNSCEELTQGLDQRVLQAVAKGRMPTYEELISSDVQVRLKRAMHARKMSRLPSIVTHDLIDDGRDPVLQHIRHRQLFNEPTDPVKVVFHPDFVTATSPLFNMDYDQFVRGCHLGVFPSYYEPWGYTPPECIALGIPAVTTDLSGFGTFVKSSISDAHENGIFVLNRSTKTPDESIEDLSSYLFRFTQQSRRDRIELRNRAERLTEAFSWSALAQHYNKAHAMAAEDLLQRRATA